MYSAETFACSVLGRLRSHRSGLFGSSLRNKVARNGLSLNWSFDDLPGFGKTLDFKMDLMMILDWGEHSWNF